MGKYISKLFRGLDFQSLLLLALAAFMVSIYFMTTNISEQVAAIETRLDAMEIGEEAEIKELLLDRELSDELMVPILEVLITRTPTEQKDCCRPTWHHAHRGAEEHREVMLQEDEDILNHITRLKRLVGNSLMNAPTPTPPETE